MRSTFPSASYPACGDGSDERLAAQNITPHLAPLRDHWLTHISKIFQAATLVMPRGSWMQKGGKQGHHGEHLGYLLAEMQFLQRAYPGAKW